MSRFIRSSTAIALAGVLAAATVSVDAKDRRECDRDYKPQVGQSGKDVVWVPTPDEVVQRMLRMAKVTPQDTVYDLGAGDGKIAIAAGKIGATSVGIEYNPDMAKLAQCYVQAENLAGKTRIIQGDVFKEDFSKASVVTMYLLPELNLRLRPTILNMKPGTRVTSHQFTMGDWEPDETAEVDYRIGLSVDRAGQSRRGLDVARARQQRAIRRQPDPEVSEDHRRRRGRFGEAAIGRSHGSRRRNSLRI